MLRGRESTNIEDRRGMGGRGIALGGGGIGVLILALYPLENGLRKFNHAEVTG